jgi:hypothetical protein
MADQDLDPHLFESKVLAFILRPSKRVVGDPSAYRTEKGPSRRPLLQTGKLRFRQVRAFRWQLGVCRKKQ